MQMNLSIDGRDETFSIPVDMLQAIDIPAVFGEHVAPSYIECGLIELATHIAREEGR